MPIQVYHTGVLRSQETASPLDLTVGLVFHERGTPARLRDYCIALLEDTLT